MCAFSVALIDFDKLSAKQKKDLLEIFQKKKAVLQTQLKETDTMLKSFSKAVKMIETKSKPKSKSKSKRRR
jgi:hypothetical protein